MAAIRRKRLGKSSTRSRGKEARSECYRAFFFRASLFLPTLLGIETRYKGRQQSNWVRMCVAILRVVCLADLAHPYRFNGECGLGESGMHLIARALSCTGI